jgi:hypothetical protein
MGSGWHGAPGVADPTPKPVAQVAHVLPAAPKSQRHVGAPDTSVHPPRPLHEAARVHTTGGGAGVITAWSMNSWKPNAALDPTA